MVEYFLALDEPRLDDAVTLHQPITFVYDQKATDEIGDYLKIDYRNNGYVLINKQQTLSYGLTLK